MQRLSDGTYIHCLLGMQIFGLGKGVFVSFHVKGVAEIHMFQGRGSRINRNMITVVLGDQRNTEEVTALGPT